MIAAQQKLTFGNYAKSLEPNHWSSETQLIVLNPQSTRHFSARWHFSFLSGGLWNSIRSVENEIDKVHIAVALATNEAQQFRFGRAEDQARHRIEHRRERERTDRIVDFIKEKYNFSVKPGDQ